MKIQHFDQQGQHVIVYFAGWGTPPSVVQHLRLPENYDLVICYDYQQLACDFDFTSYQTIRVVAWSMGVWVAKRIMQPYQLSSATAINGTGYPCHDQFGIPCTIFEGTLTGLNEENRHKFERRICGNKTALQDYQQLAQRPTLDEIYSELTALYQGLQQDQRTDLILWSKAIIGTKDKIFPAQHQRDYWQSRCQITEVEAEHLLFPQFSHWAQCWEYQCKS
ncbi:pimeloyl-ACP methyl esterase BioG family protein [Pasteurella oralis]|uniref:Pimeloyl-ACP methyl esterase BioG family protein n=1 Tax=Pasteurella oralis TaxID=1071947 RepID=A0ABW4NZI1_9PAST